MERTREEKGEEEEYRRKQPLMTEPSGLNPQQNHVGFHVCYKETKGLITDSCS